MPFCDACDGWYFQSHECPPIWDTAVVLSVGDDVPDWQPFRAPDAEGAAIKAAEHYDCEDYSLLRGHTVEILVRAKTTASEILRFKCRGEMVAQYRAKEIYVE